MIISYRRPNILYLPYIDPRDNVTKIHNFVPGKQSIEKEVWDAVNKYNKNDMEYYIQFFRIIGTGSNNGKNNEKETIDISKLKINEAIELISDTMEANELYEYRDQERARTPMRKTIMKELEKKINEVVSIDKLIEAKEEG